MPAKAAPKPIEKMTYEESLAELQETVAGLEAEPKSLETAIAMFERGQKLVARCSELLEAATLRVQQLTGQELSDFEEE